MKTQVLVRALNCFSHISYGVKDPGQEFYIENKDLEHLIETDNVEVVVKKALRVPILDQPVPFVEVVTEATPPLSQQQAPVLGQQTYRRRGRPVRQ